MESHQRILIAGCGDIGTEVGAALVKEGCRVTGLRRSKVMDDTGITHVQADLTREETFETLSADYDLVLAIVSPSERTVAGYEAIYLNGVGNLLRHLMMRGNRPTVIYISSTRVYGQERGEWVDEFSETVPNDEYGLVLLAAERQVLELYEGNSIVRFSGIYGRGESHLVKLLRTKTPVQYSPPCYTNRVHKEDCVGALLFLIRQRLADEALAPCYLVSDDEPAARWDVLAWLAKQQGLPEPEKMVSAGARQGKRCSNQLIRAAGYNFRYPSFREGYSKSSYS